ncbi:MAG: hydrogenase maturation protease [Phycisphaerales bacterium]|nr:hydrogenase maturation protease [Phycisphaerales bacterium]MCB9854363.1 hydrogenase maturation protease [Phycisphaerales bacterium]MCB9863564.1 hydrogenase maturation protease [Phycisphaerales bacterium]
MSIERTGRTRVVGCGRWFRRDDQVGLLVVQTLNAMGSLPAGIAATEAPGAELADQFDDCDRLILVDAAAADQTHPPGSWQVIDYRRDPGRLRPRRSDSTHTLSVDAALRLAGELGMLPPSVSIYAIAVADTRQGDELSPAVRAVVPRIAASIASALWAGAGRSDWGACHA